MSLSLVQGYNSYPSNSQTLVVVQAGDLIIVAYDYNDALKTSTCTDNAAGGSNTYTRVPGTAIGAGATADAGEDFYAIAKASETLTITCTAQTDNGIMVHVVRGNNTTLASVLDASNTGSTPSNTAHTSTDVVTGTANDYLFVHWYQKTAVASLTENGTGFTKEEEDTNAVHQTFDQIVSATGTYHDTVTASTPIPMGHIILAFKAAAGGGGFTPAFRKTLSGIGSRVGTRQVHGN